jgi:hypothetical protein
MMFLSRLWWNRNCDSCEKKTTGTKKTGIRTIPAGFIYLASPWLEFSECRYFLILYRNPTCVDVDTVFQRVFFVGLWDAWWGEYEKIPQFCV